MANCRFGDFSALAELLSSADAEYVCGSKPKEDILLSITYLFAHFDILRKKLAFEAYNWTR